MVLGKLPVPGRPTFWIIVGQGPIALAVVADGGCRWGLFGHFFSPLSVLSSFSCSLGDSQIWTEILSQRATKLKTINQSVSRTLVSIFSKKRNLTDCLFFLLSSGGIKIFMPP